MAAPASHQHDVQEVAARSSPEGIKSAAVVKALKLVAKGIRKGNKYFVKAFELLDSRAKGPFLKHAAQIADVLEDIAIIPDVAYAILGAKLFSILTKAPFDLPGGTANTIVQALIGAINLAL